MRRLAVLLLLAGVAPGSAAWAAEAGERWVAASNTASSITGDVRFSSGRIRFANGASLELASVSPLPRFRANGETVAAMAYRVVTPADPLLLNGNRLCGGPDKPQKVTFIVVWGPRKLPGDAAPRSFAAFSGAQPTAGTGDAGACGTFNYDRP